MYRFAKWLAWTGLELEPPMWLQAKFLMNSVAIFMVNRILKMCWSNIGMNGNMHLLLKNIGILPINPSKFEYFYLYPYFYCS